MSREMKIQEDITRNQHRLTNHLVEQNKRYREALEEILTLEKYNETDNFWDNDDDFYMYIQNTAKKALEESE